MRGSGHLSQFLARELHIEEGRTEGLALLRVLHRDGQCLLDSGGRRHGNEHALVGQRAHQLPEALAFDLAQQLVGWHAHAVEEQLRRVRCLHADLLQ